MTLIESRDRDAAATRAEALEQEARRQTYGDRYSDVPTVGLPSILVRLAGRVHRQTRWGTA